MNPTRAPQRAFTIRPASPEDAASILACLQAAFAPYRNQYTPDAFADTVPDLEGIDRRLRDMSLFIAISEGATIGTIAAAVNGEEGHLRGMAVLPAWEGTGVAAALLQAAEDELRKRGCTHVTLDTTAPLSRAIRFYQKHGFRRSHRISDFFGMSLYEYKKAL